MKVRRLIEMLSTMNQDATVIVMANDDWSEPYETSVMEFTADNIGDFFTMKGDAPELNEGQTIVTI